MAEKLPPEVQQVASQLDELQEKYTAVVNQRVLLETEISEIKKVLETLNDIGEDSRVFQSVGNILFEEKKDKLLDKLNEKKETDELLLQKYKKEEEELKKQISVLQEKLRTLVAKYYQRFAAKPGGAS
jgi:prefoldin beta subunit